MPTEVPITSAAVSAHIPAGVEGSPGEMSDSGIRSTRRRHFGEAFLVGERPICRPPTDPHPHNGDDAAQHQNSNPVSPLC